MCQAAQKSQLVDVEVRTRFAPPFVGRRQRFTLRSVRRSLLSRRPASARRGPARARRPVAPRVLRRLLCLGPWSHPCARPGSGRADHGCVAGPPTCPDAPLVRRRGKGVKPGRVRTPREPTVRAARRRARGARGTGKSPWRAGARREGQLRGVVAAGRRLCNDGPMAKTVIVKLTDDLDGGDADETVTFALDGRSYEIDVSSANAARLRDALKPFVAKARPSVGRSGARRRSPHSLGLRRDNDVLAIEGGREGSVPELGRYGDGPADQRRTGEELDRGREALTESGRACRRAASPRATYAQPSNP